MELKNIYWSLFEGTGSIQAYLVYKEICATNIECKENNNYEYKENDNLET